MAVPIITFPDGGQGAYPNQIQYTDWFSPGTLKAFFAWDQAPGNIYELETSIDLINWTPTRRANVFQGRSCVTYDIYASEGFARIKIITKERFLEIQNS